jgi:hypothetical protein
MGGQKGITTSSLVGVSVEKLQGVGMVQGGSRLASGTTAGQNLRSRHVKEVSLVTSGKAELGKHHGNMGLGIGGISALPSFQSQLSPCFLCEAPQPLPGCAWHVPAPAT